MPGIRNMILQPKTGISAQLIMVDASKPKLDSMDRSACQRPRQAGGVNSERVL